MTDSPPERPPTDYRTKRQQQERTTLLLVIFALVVVGSGLIGLIWGPTVALSGGLCLLTAAALIIGLWFLLSLIERRLTE